MHESARHWVLHVDMDQFLVAVELLRRPELVGLPVVVGGRGDPTERAVVSTASYEARTFGVRSGLALKLAVRRCPQAIFLPVDFPHYEAASVRVMETLREFPGTVVEILGWDEAFVGVTTADPEATARAIQAAVFEATGLHCSVGIGDTLVRAKIATEFGKPQGRFTLTAGNWFAVMGDKPTTALWGIGKKTAARLATVGIETVRDLATSADDILIAAFGPTSGPRLGQLGRGEGRTGPDDTPWVARAHGHECTYQTDLTTPEQIKAALLPLAEQVVADLHAEGRAAVRVHLKVRFVPFFTQTRVRKLAGRTYDPQTIADTAYELFTGTERNDRPVRLLGVRAEMEPPPGGY